ncbi:hypothetical protein AR438_06490 [Chryseobacterium aquaticum]|uniref:DUF262 domain-containing protein n=1 Tax=Chryseobacterium aquaticum TaxID=452084 RepID=A0A0Q3HV28_9FLAO|nr:DUF262 domain-containing protein [Chryseobacterium aquaticum]KQK26413.1 hypothetical protein AR438_06490 [Chryseobacterium aquaticum]
MNSKFVIESTSILSFKKKVNIPSYQRPYCWGKEEIEKLLNDFKDNSEDDYYFIGNVITIKNGKYYDLIDGQQRFTTIWILCLYLYSKSRNNQLFELCYQEDSPRLHFAIRTETNNYLKALLKKVEDSSAGEDKFWKIDQFLPDENDLTNPTLMQNLNIAKSFRIIDEWIKNDIATINIKKFEKFVIEKVQFKFLVAPEGSDENNLFIQINTNGTQFQHYDILKAELINALSHDTKGEYSKKWEWATEIFYFKTDSKQEKNGIDEKVDLLLSDIINSEGGVEYFGEENEENTEKQENKFEYLISFNTILLHTLFIYSKKYKLKLPEHFNEEKLLDIFQYFRKSVEKGNLHREINAKYFIDLLAEVKEKMNSHILFKDIEKNTFSLLTENQKNYEYDDDDDDDDEVLKQQNSEFVQLQRMLYHSSNDKKQFWLGVLLDRLINNNDYSLKVLEKIDNVFSIRGNTFEIYKSYFEDSEIFLSSESLFVIENFSFTFKNFNRYWFYKVEYLLWKNYKEKLNATNNTIISRTSVEHVLPQKEEAYFQENNVKINDFGNLILITVSENSGFSAKSLLKKYEYYEKLNNPPLKMKLLFNQLEEKNLLVQDSELKKENLEVIKTILESNKMEILSLIIQHYC